MSNLVNVIAFGLDDFYEIKAFCVDRGIAKNSHRYLGPNGLNRAGGGYRLSPECFAGDNVKIPQERSLII